MSGISNALRGKASRSVLIVAAMLLSAICASAQLEVGDNIKMNLNGNLGFGYTGTFGNASGSSHGNGLIGNADLNGYYFHPNFLNFQFRPYYDRSQSNADSQVITQGTGMLASVGLFGGSRFPGSISYGKEFSSSSEFRVAGIPTVVGDGSGQQLNLNWSALIPDRPTLRASYFMGSTRSSVLGSSTDSKTSSKNLTLNSEYRWAGFDLHGNFTNVNTHFTSPEYLTPFSYQSSGASTTYGITAQHKLPLSGTLGLGWSRSNYSVNRDSEASGSTYSAAVGFSPWSRFSISENVTYTTNLTSAVAQSVLGDQGAPLLRLGSNSDSLLLFTTASYHVGHGFGLSGHLSHREQHYSGREYSDTQYGGAVNYNKYNRFLGFMYFSVGVIDTANKEGNVGAGFVSNVGMNKKFGHWDTSADFSYSQNVETLVVFATTSSYTYGGSVRRKISRELSWSGAFRGAHTGLTMQEGSGSRSETFTGTLSWKRTNFSGSYSQSSGTAVLTSSGALTPTVVGSLITDSVMMYDARSFGGSVSTHVGRRLLLSGGYTNAVSNSALRGLNTANSGERYSARVEYKLRKFALIGGFNRAAQDVSTIPGGPRVVNSYYLSLSRWFNVL